MMFVAYPAEADDQTLLLSVEINGYTTGKIGEFVDRDGVLLSRPEELHDLGFKLPEALAAGTDGLILLSDLKEVAWRLDMPSQMLFATTTNAHLLPTILQVRPPRLADVPIESGLGATLNYDISATNTGTQNSGTGAFDMRVFSPWGVASTDFLAFSGGGPAGPGTNSAVRLMSTYIYSDPETLRRYSVGDFITDGLSWNRAIRLGGVQVTSDFTMRPDLITFPLPSLSGGVSVPSTVDLMVNGNQMLSRQIGAGPFEIPQLPVVTGAGTISMTLTNALGLPVVVTMPFYASATLLAPGLQTYALQAGMVRLNFGLDSFNYDRPAVMGAYRRGVTDWLTLESSMEGAGGTFMTGGGGVVNLHNFAVLNFTAAGSIGSGGGAPTIDRTVGAGAGGLVSVGIQRTSRTFSFGASATMASRDYRDIAALYGAMAPRLQLNASAGMSLGRFGSVGLAYAEVDHYAIPSPVQVYVPAGSVLNQNVTQTGGTLSQVGGLTFFQPAQKTQIGSASYSIQAGPVAVYATAFHDFANPRVSGVLLGVTVPLGSRNSVSASVGSGSSGGYQSMQATQSAVSIGDWGYQVFGTTGNPPHEFAQVQYRSPWALVQLGADRIGHLVSSQVEAQGAISIVGGGVFASNAIDDSFAVVDTNGLKGVRVLRENRLVGRTDSKGRLLVPGLRSFDLNRISIDPNDVPLDSSIDIAVREVRPQDRSGIVVKFGVQVSHGALLRLVDAAGTPIQLGSTARLAPKGVLVPVGYDGEAYVLDLSPHNQLLVERPGGDRCEAAFDYKPIPGQIPTIGPLPCLEKAP